MTQRGCGALARSSSAAAAWPASVATACQLTAIAMSEDSWASFTEGQIEATADQLRGLINSSFNQGSLLEDDLNSVQQSLDAMRPPIRYRIVSILIPMAGK